MKTPSMVFNLPGNETSAARLADALSVPQGALLTHVFPDGETYVRGVTRCDNVDALLFANLFRPDSKFLPVAYATDALRDLGARRVLLVSPYLPYLRQDTRFKSGEVITSRIFAKLISETVDGVITIDPHLHRYAALGDVYSIPTEVRHATAPIAAWIRSNLVRPVIVGPDGESLQWVREVAGMAGAPYVVLSKVRLGDRDVKITAPELTPWRDYTPVLVDDIISTAKTMILTIRHLTAAGCGSPVCIGVHAIFSDRAYEDLLAAGAKAVVTCKSIDHSSNEIDITPLLAAGVRALCASTTSGAMVDETTGLGD